MTLKQLILETGLKQNWIADKIGMSQSHFSEAVRGVKGVPVEKVRSLADTLRVTSDQVLAAIAETIEERMRDAAE